MNSSIQSISLLDLAIIFVPVFFVIGILFKWSLEIKSSLYAVSRMLLQLLLIGYFLTFIFESDSAGTVGLVLVIMVFASSWIALRTIPVRRKHLYPFALISVGVGGGVILLIVTQGVLNLSPWYMPQYLIPLAGMIFANSMNSVSLAAERLYSEMERGDNYKQARKKALHAALIPITNSLFAVGLVSIPGMMTGQILSGVSPFIAARYQIMVMCMIFASAGISATMFLLLVKQKNDTRIAG